MTATTLSPGTAEDAGLDATQLQRIRERCSQWVDDGLTKSIVVAVARHGVVALHEAFGNLTPEPESPTLEVDSIFPVSSLCKPVTAAAFMMLVEEGLAGIHDRAIDWLPELSAAGKDVKNVLVRHLLTHTSGYTDMDVMAYQAEQLKERLDLPPLPEGQHKSIHLALNARYGAPLTRQPEEVMCYCTHNYELVGEIIRRASGKPLEGFASERIFEPLGMKDSSYRLEARFGSRMVKRLPHENPFGADLNDERYLDTPWAGGGMKSTALDMMKFGQCCLNGGSYGDHRLLSRNTIRAMTSNQVPPGVPEEDMMRNIPQGSYGFGFFVFGDHTFAYNGALQPRGSYSHAGMGGVFMTVDPLNDVVCVLFETMEFDQDVVPWEDPPKLTPAKLQDMVTAAVL